jgi:hypothetical protein
MTSDTTGLESAAEGHGHLTELARYVALFAEAFDELHDAVVTEVSKPGQHVSPHSDYPVMSRLDSGFPAFHESGFWRSNTPTDYVGTIRPRGLLGALGSGYVNRELSFPRGAELASFLRTVDIGDRLDLNPDGKAWDWPIDNLVRDAVERYLHLYGLRDPVEPKRRDAIIRPLVLGTVWRRFDLRLVVPITMTHFEVDRFPLTETTYIVRLPKRFQLARAQMSTLGTGAVRMVVGAATHAFVSKGWSLESDNISEVRRSLSQSSPNVLDAIDSFFGALRVATGISTGYAQLLWAPKGWTLDYFCDLTPIYGTTLRRYPDEYDNYGWVAPGATVSIADLVEVRRTYRAIINSQSEAIRLALSRLNGCLMRADAADAILDGTIGLELLLGDDQNQSLAYKLRLRAAALTLVSSDGAYPVSEIASKVKRLYDARSAIVHGRRRRRSKKASEPADTVNVEERSIAADLLRFVLNTLLVHPEYLDPAKIDDGLLLRGDIAIESVAIKIGDHPQSRKSKRAGRLKSREKKS